ncbi:MAG: hypothetical protein WCL44_12965 [bacterium]
MKVCTKCKRPRRKDAFRRYWGRSSDGLRPICRDCQQRYEAKWRKIHAERRRQSREKRKDKEAVYRQEYDRLHRGAMLAKEAVRRCRRKGLPCDLLHHLVELEARVQAGRCELSGLPFDFHAKGTAWNSPSLHRTRPELGYTLANVKVICFCLNAALGNWGEVVLKNVAASWLERN